LKCDNEKFEIEIPESSPNIESKTNTPKTTGKITDMLGSGEDAKNSIAYLVLKWIFFTAIVIIVIVSVNNLLFRVNEKVPDIASDIKFIWDIVSPIITLILGYVFGKSYK
jgi:hypothetical protein